MVIDNNKDDLRLSGVVSLYFTTIDVIFSSRINHLQFCEILKWNDAIS